MEDLIRISVEGVESSLEDFDARESVAAGLAKAKDHKGQTTDIEPDVQFEGLKTLN